MEGPDQIQQIPEHDINFKTNHYSLPPSGGVLITIGLGLVLYTYTIHYHAHTRISGAIVLNAGLLMEIFTVAAWNGGAI